MSSRLHGALVIVTGVFFAVMFWWTTVEDGLKAALTATTLGFAAATALIVATIIWDVVRARRSLR